jgi:hypothetical protein
MSEGHQVKDKHIWIYITTAHPKGRRIAPQVMAGYPSYLKCRVHQYDEQSTKDLNMSVLKSHSSVSIISEGVNYGQ